jgi:hypothetical protein
MDDPLTLSPFCHQPAVERFFLQTAEGHDPGCTSCEESSPMEEWAARVLAVRQGQ